MPRYGDVFLALSPTSILVFIWLTWLVTVILPPEAMVPKPQFTILPSLGDEKLQLGSRLTCGGSDDAFLRSSANRV